MEQVVLNGLVAGLGIALFALGFSLVFVPTRTFHVAAGGVYAVAPFLAFSALGTLGSWPSALGCSLGGGAALSVLCEVVNHRPLERKQASREAHLVASLGMLIVLTQLTAIIWGNETRVFRHGIDSSWKVGAIVLSRGQLIQGVTAICVLSVFYVWIRLTRAGVRFRALADNSAECGLLGINVTRYRLAAFGMSGAMVSLAALLEGYDLGFDPHGGMHAMLLAVVAVIVGGRTSFLGPIAGGVILGIVRALVVWQWSARWQDVATFLLLGLFLFVRPQGICAVSSRLETEA